MARSVGPWGPGPFAAVALAGALLGAGCFDFDRVAAVADAGGADAWIAPACDGSPAVGTGWSAATFPSGHEGGWVIELVPRDPPLALGRGGLFAEEATPAWRQLLDDVDSTYHAGVRNGGELLFVREQSGVFDLDRLDAGAPAVIAPVYDVSEPVAVVVDGGSIYVGALVSASDQTHGTVQIFPKAGGPVQVTQTELALHDLVASPRGLYACGYGYVSRWDGTSWSKVGIPQLPAASTSCGDLDVSVYDDGQRIRTRLWAVGGSEVGTAVCTLDDDAGGWQAAWTCHPLSFKGAAVAAAPCQLDTAVIAGEAGHVALTDDAGASFVEEMTLSSEDLGAAMIASNGAVYVGGPQGALFVRR